MADGRVRGKKNRGETESRGSDERWIMTPDRKVCYSLQTHGQVLQSYFYPKSSEFAVEGKAHSNTASDLCKPQITGVFMAVCFSPTSSE